MRKFGPLLALPLLLAPAAALASGVKDDAKMFGPEAVAKANEAIRKLEATYKVPVTIEAMDALPDAPDDKNAQRRAINELAVRRDRDEGGSGIFLLLSKKEHLLSNVLMPQWLAKYFPETRRLAVRDAMTAEFKNGNYDAGLARGIEKLESSLSTASAEAGGALRPRGAGAPAVPGGRVIPPAPGRNGIPRVGGNTGMSTLIMLGLGLLAVMFVLRLLGGMFRGATGGYGPGPGAMGGPGYRGGPGYGGGGYGGGGGGGGGFMSGLMGGLGGAVAGNWLYDKFGGRHADPNAGYGDVAGAGGAAAGYDSTQNDIVGGNDDGGQGASWGDSGGGGGDVAGGDWGGGGGGDWGGGGGGDAGGGGGGGDW